MGKYAGLRFVNVIMPRLPRQCITSYHTVMNMPRSPILIAVAIVLLIVGGGIFWRSQQRTADTQTAPPLPHLDTITTPLQQVEKKIEDVVKKTEEKIDTTIHPITTLSVPFTSQAPFGDWDDPRQQDGCEEASLIMVWHWRNKTPLTSADALKEILTMSHWSEEHIGEYLSTSAADTAKIFREYYKTTDITVRYDITAEDIKAELAKGKVIIVPSDGRELHNPNFKQPGPPEHMLVVIGYDERRDEFVTNDPGTRNGKGYRYSATTLMNAIGDYPTGHHLPNPNPRTAMLVVEP